MVSILCLGEVWLELAAESAPETAEIFQPRAGGWGAEFCLRCLRSDTPVALLAQLGADPFGRKLAAQLAAVGVDCTRLCFTEAAPTPVVFTGADAPPLPYRKQGAGLKFSPEQLECSIFRDGFAFCFSSAGLVDSPLRMTHLKALAAGRDAGVLCCYEPDLARSASFWPDDDFLRQTALQFLPLADILLIKESDLFFLFGSSEYRTALFSLFTGHVQMIFYSVGDKTYIFTRNVMVSSPQQDPILLLKRLEQTGITPASLPGLKANQLL